MTDRVSIGASSDFAEGAIHKVKVAGTTALVVRAGGTLCAVENRCAHLPVPLDRGTVEDGAIICPLHNSKYDLKTGENLDWVPGVIGVKVPTWSRALIALGKKPTGIRAFTVVEEDGQAFIEP
ncbi:MAG: Rieske (2Fe-2S) protein [Sandaracinaceae bacterium]